MTLPAEPSHEYLVEFRPYEDAVLPNRGWGHGVRLRNDDNGQPWSRWAAHQMVRQMNSMNYGATVARVLKRPVGDWQVDEGGEQDGQQQGD